MIGAEGSKGECASKQAFGNLSPKHKPALEVNGRNNLLKRCTCAPYNPMMSALSDLIWLGVD